MITAQAAILHAIIGRPPDPDRRRLILRHFARTRRPDGGWGLHPESHSYLFVTVLVYVAARLLGEPAGSPLLGPAAGWLARHPDGLAGLPSWGRFWLSLIGLYDALRVPPCPPELYLLPNWFPLSPNRLYCHTRYIYLGMAFLWGSGFRADLGPMRESLQAELARFAARRTRPRHHVATSDLHVRPGWPVRLAYRALAALGPAWLRFPVARRLRQRALRRCLDRIRAEQHGSHFQALSPVNGILNTLALWSVAPDGPDCLASLAGLEAWCWRDEAEGLRYAGARSTSWDTAFALQAAGEAPDPDGATRSAMRRGYLALAALQITEEPATLDEGRQKIAGGWCFGTPAHRLPVSDCTAEALSALLLCQTIPGLIAGPDRIPRARLAAAVRFLLDRQNADGGFASYERRRGGRMLARLNPSEMFGQCMTELSYVECTASAIRALHQLATTEPSIAPAECRDAMGRGRRFLLSRQRPDGAWPGFWGINFVYATGLAVVALRDVGLGAEHRAVCKAVGWLRSVQNEDGGWGEHFSGCLSGRYVPHPESLVITTAWALLALLRAEAEPSPATRRGLDWLAGRQLADGDWPRDSVNGVFFGTAMLDYRLYNTYFPAWALARARACGIGGAR